MPNSVANVAVAALVGAAVAVIAGAIGFERLVAGGPKKMVHAEIHLDVVNAQCKIQTSPQTLEAYKKETVQWSIIDRCGITDTTDVVIEFDPAKNPLDAACTPTGKKKITCKLKNGVDIDTYKYTVKAGDLPAEDPELEIVQ